MPIIHLLVALTILVVIGYFVLLSSARAEGRLKTFGRILAIWLFVLPVVGLIAAAAHGGRHGGWHGGWRGGQGMMRHGPPPEFRQPPGNPDIPAPVPPAAGPGAPPAPK